MEQSPADIRVKAEPSVSSPSEAHANQSPTPSTEASIDEIQRFIDKTALKRPIDPGEPEPTRDELCDIPPLDALTPEFFQPPRRGRPIPPLLYYGYITPPNARDLMVKLGHVPHWANTFTEDVFEVLYVRTNHDGWVVDKTVLPGFIEVFGGGVQPKWYLSVKQPRWVWPAVRYRAKTKANTEKDAQKKDEGGQDQEGQDDK